MRKQKIHFITYGDSKYFVQRHHLKSTAKASKFFDSSKAYSPKDLDSNFKQKFSTILKEKKGAGFWIWKHHIIEKELDRLNYNDLLVWSDAGSSFNYFAKEKFDEYVELLNTSSNNNLRFKMKHIENTYRFENLI